MKIVNGKPPNYNEIVSVLPAASGKGIIFTYGETIFAPGLGAVSQPLMIHESVHSERQGPTEASIKAWWRNYLKSIEFRFHEELMAHQAEYKECRRLYKDRNQLARLSHQIAARLASELYGGIISYPEAIKAISGGRYMLCQ